MKIAITYTREEEEEACRQLEQLQQAYPLAKIRKSARHAPFFHVYLTVKNTKKPHEIKHEI